MNYQRQIIDYYDSSQWLYSLFVYDETSLGMHFGFWETGTKNRQQAILNENQEIIDIGKIRAGMKILDAGCGVGGTAIYIAKKTGAKVWGITLSENQVKLANKYAEKNKVRNLVDFSMQDFNKTNFPNKFFDVVYGIESICHAYPKSKFLKGAYRLLKPGGKLIIADGYTSSKRLSNGEKNIVAKFCESFALKELTSYPQMEKQIHNSGFKITRAVDKTYNVRPSIESLGKSTNLANYLLSILEWLPFTHLQAIKKNKEALNAALEAINSRLFKYYIHSAQKPKLRRK